MAQTPLYPAKILFFCEVAAEEGGATPICRSDVLFERLAAARPQFARDCDEAFFAGTAIESNFLCNLGYGRRESLHPRNPRLLFRRATG